MNLAIIGSANDLSHVRHQAIVWINAELLNLKTSSN